jgi:hypothetical protein
LVTFQLDESSMSRLTGDDPYIPLELLLVIAPVQVV